VGHTVTAICKRATGRMTFLEGPDPARGP